MEGKEKIKTVEGITFNYEKDGVQLRKQIEKRILSSTGTWATLMVRHQDLDRTSGEFKDPRVTLARFKKTGGVWKKQNSFNINTREQASSIVQNIISMFGLTQEEIEPSEE